MNLLQVERNFKRIQQREAELKYFYNPTVKYKRGKRQHPYISHLKKDMKRDRKRYGMSPYVAPQDGANGENNNDYETGQSPVHSPKMSTAIGSVLSSYRSKNSSGYNTPYAYSDRSHHAQYEDGPQFDRNRQYDAQRGVYKRSSFGVANTSRKRVLYSLNGLGVKTRLLTRTMRAKTIKNQAALMAIKQSQNSPETLQTRSSFSPRKGISEMRQSTITDKNFTFLSKMDHFVTSSGQCTTDRSSRSFNVKTIPAKKPPPVPASLKLEFSLNSNSEDFAIRITDVSLNDRPTNQILFCKKTADKLLNVNGSTVVHPSVVLPWITKNTPKTLLWQIREHDPSNETTQVPSRVLIRHITFLQAFEPKYVPIVSVVNKLGLFINNGILRIIGRQQLISFFQSIEQVKKEQLKYQFPARFCQSMSLLLRSAS